jgi:hypothetical protein
MGCISVLFGGPTSLNSMPNNTATPQELYRFHTENLRALVTAKEQIAPLAKHAIAIKAATELSSLLKLYAFLVGAWAEVRLQKVLYEPNAFADSDRASIKGQRTQLDQWKRTVEIAFRKHYSISEPQPLSLLPFTPRARYGAIAALLDNELQLVINVRNKLAHGQWAYALNSEGTAIETNMMRELRTENFMSLQFKDDLIGNIAEIVNTLVISKPTFERDFDALFKMLEQLQTNLHCRKYEKYEALLIANHGRERQRRLVRMQIPS